MSQRAHTFRTSRTSRVSGNFMASRASLGAAPSSTQPSRQRTNEVIDLISDDDDEPTQEPKSHPPAPAQHQDPSIVDLTRDTPSRSPSPPQSRPSSKSAPKGPSPRVRSPVPPLTGDSSPDEGAHSPLPPLTRDSSPERPEHRVRQDVAVKQASNHQIKISPQTLQNQRKQDQLEETRLSRRQISGEKPRPSTPQLSDEDDDENGDGHLPQDFQPSPSTPSKQASSRSHRRSQKSTDISIGSSSPLITRLKHRRNSKQINENTKTRSQSPRENMSHQSVSSELTSHGQPLTQEELEKSLQGFESKLKDGHAFGMRWLLQDVRESVADRRSSFFDAPFVETGDFSPWTSKTGIQVQPTQPIGDVPHFDKLDSFVSSKTKPDYVANKHRLWPKAGSPRQEAN